MAHPALGHISHNYFREYDEPDPPTVSGKFNEQIGGDHYEKLDIQPWEVIERANLDFWEGNVVKYILRYKDKNGEEDLRKALHYLEYLIKREANK